VTVDGAFQPLLDTEIILWPTKDLLANKHFLLDMPAPAAGAQVKVIWQVLGSRRDAEEEEAFPWLFAGEAIEAGPSSLDPNPGDFSFLDVKDAVRTIFVKPGQWEVNKTLVLPAGYTVVCQEDTELDLKQGATIISYSPLDFRGSRERPIVIRSTDGLGQGLTVFRAGERSALEWVNFLGLANPSAAGWQLPGAVTFHESPVDIENCSFEGNTCGDDFLNIVASDFSITNVIFSNIKADALDVDFGSGRIVGTDFLDCGNDAIDVSGTTLYIESGTLRNIGDKGLSGGEDSRFTARGVTIEGAELAVASKDNSYMVLDDVHIKGCKVGLTAYQKKPEFGPGTIEARQLVLVDVGIPYLVEERSTVRVDDVQIPSSRDNVKEILYGVEFGKSSKPQQVEK
jgi:hypothetical protein